MVRSAALLVSIGLALALGCSQQAAVPQVKYAELGRQFVLEHEPEGAVGILDFREAQPQAEEVALLGRIGGGRPTWSSRSASFLISDPTHEFTAEGGHACHDDNCPFCKGKKEQDPAQAIVMLTDEEGRVPAFDARELLPLAEGQMIVVRGRAEINALGQLVVHARGLYVRR
jgi:hypothetical protein